MSRNNQVLPKEELNDMLYSMIQTVISSDKKYTGYKVHTSCLIKGDDNRCTLSQWCDEVIRMLLKNGHSGIRFNICSQLDNNTPIPLLHCFLVEDGLVLQDMPGLGFLYDKNDHSFKGIKVEEVSKKDVQ